MCFERYKSRSIQTFSVETETSTKADVIDAHGKPETTVVKKDGTYQVIYICGHAQVRSESLIPYVGLVTGGQDVETTSVFFDFDKRQIFTSLIKGNTE